MLLPGDLAPFFNARSTVNPDFNFDTAAGRYIVLSFFGSTRIPTSRVFLDEVVRRGEFFDVTNFIFFGVTNDAEDAGTIQHQHNGRIYFFDPSGTIGRAYGVIENNSATNPPVIALTPTTFVLDAALRVMAVFRFSKDPVAAASNMFSFLESLPALRTRAPAAPVLIVPYVLEAELCRQLIQYYEDKGGEDSGFMRDVNGKTTGLIDYSHKRRMDCEITDHGLIDTVHNRLRRRLIPAIQQAFQFSVSRIERNIVACYDADQGAHFRAHRDNTTLGTAHRRFAVTINLNSPEYEGGEIWFPEFGPKLFKAPSGAAIVFSCSLLHEVPKVTRGKRYAYLPFLYDETAAAVRERNRKHLGDLSGAGGGGIKPKACNATPTAGPHAVTLPAIPTDPSANRSMTPVLDGSCGCGNPNGCQTCLSAEAYQINTSNDKPAKP